MMWSGGSAAQNLNDGRRMYWKRCSGRNGIAATRRKQKNAKE